MTLEIQLASSEAARLAELEAIVDSGLDTFVTVGRALAEISTGRLYRATHGTFVAYAQDRFGIGKSHAYRMISAAKVAEAVSPIGDITTESQARELVGLDDDEARGVLAVAQAGAKLQGREQPTAEDIRQSRSAWERADVSSEEMTADQARDLTEFINITSSFDGDLASDTADQLAASDADYARQAADMERELREERPAPAPTAPRRRPLPDAFFDAAHDLRKVTERIERLSDDDRFPSNAEQVAARYRNDLLRAIDALQGVVNRLPSA